MLLLLALACATTPEAAPADPVTAPGSGPAPAAAVAPPAAETPAPAARPLQPGDKEAGFTARCADGQVVVPFWQGEYPSPIVQIGEGVNTRVATDPCGKANRDCALPPGLYHPWAGDSVGPAELGFGTRLRTSRYTAKQATTVAGVAVAAGAELEVLTYLSEGMCSMRHGGVIFEEMCPGTTDGDDAIWAEVAGPAGDPTQLLEVRCTGETRPFWLTVDAALMATKGVQEGAMLGYGEIGPAGSGPGD
jgi:hypothetical protein